MKITTYSKKNSSLPGSHEARPAMNGFDICNRIFYDKRHHEFSNFDKLKDRGKTTRSREGPGTSPSPGSLKRSEKIFPVIKVRCARSHVDFSASGRLSQKEKGDGFTLVARLSKSNRQLFISDKSPMNIFTSRPAKILIGTRGPGRSASPACNNRINTLFPTLSNHNN